VAGAKRSRFFPVCNSIRRNSGNGKGRMARWASRGNSGIVRPFKQITCQARRHGNTGKNREKATRQAFAAVRFGGKCSGKVGGFAGCFGFLCAHKTTHRSQSDFMLSFLKMLARLQGIVIIVLTTSAWIEWLTGSATGKKLGEQFPDKSHCIVQLELSKWLVREVGEE
jgi:hypothetical protein